MTNLLPLANSIKKSGKFQLGIMVHARLVHSLPARTAITVPLYRNDLRRRASAK